MARVILFAEVPCFYAEVERAEDPALATRPVVVGGDPRKGGRVQSATPDALAEGVRLEMTMLDALQCCPRARAVRTDMAHYREVSRRLMATLRGVVTPLEPFGLSGGFADLAGASADAEALASALRAAVRHTLGLPVRVGIASGKFLARLAAEEVIEEGLRRISGDDERDFLAPLPVARLDGVGRKTAATLAELGAHTIGDVAALGRDRLHGAFGTHGLRIHALATGADDEPVRGARHPQSMSREATVQEEPLDVALLAELLAGLAQQLEAELGRQALATGKVTLKLRFRDQGTTTRTRSLDTAVTTAAEIHGVAQVLLARTQAGARPVRGLGLQVASLMPAAEHDRQLGLFPEED